MNKPLTGMRFCIIIMLLAGAGRLCAQLQTLTITPLTANAFVYTTYNDFKGTAFPANGMYIVTPGGVVLIDTPWDSTRFQPLLDSIAARHGRQAVLCISTHFHDDRTAGLEYYRSKGIATYTSKQTFDLCHLRGEKQAEFYFTKDTVFTVGGVRIETFYPGPGHTADNIVVAVPQYRVLHGGCFVKSTEAASLGNLADADTAAWPASIRRVLKKYPGYQNVVPGHQGWASNRGLQHTLKLLKQAATKK